MRSEGNEPEAGLFAQIEQVDLAEKAFHDAVAQRNEAQIAYLRASSIITRAAVETAKTATRSPTASSKIFCSNRKGIASAHH